MRFDIWSILIIVIVFQGLFLLASLWATRNTRSRTGDIYLVSIIIILLWFLIEFFTVRNKLNVGLNIFYGTRYGSWFLLGPFIYFYFKKITDSNWQWRSKELAHFIPFIVFTVLIPLISYKVLNDRQVDYGMLSVFDHREKVIAPMEYLYSVVFIAQFIHLGLYLFMNLRFLRTYTRQLPNEVSYVNSNIKWLQRLHIILLSLLVLTGLFLYLLLITDVYRRHLDYLYVLPIGVFFYYISFRFMRSNWQTLDIGKKYAQSSLDARLIPTHVSKLRELLDKEKVYLNPQISLGDLATSMGISKNHLSQVINQHFECSFYDLINEHRISEAKHLIAKHPSHTMLQVAFESGFNNKTSFVNAFKKFAGCTPSQYRTSAAS